MAASPTVLTASSETDSRPVNSQDKSLDRILECAVALNWKDLTKPDEATSIQVEYRAAASHLLDYLKLWSSTQRGHWRLICEYWMQSSDTHQSGATFHDGIYSADLAWMLDTIMQHQGSFPPSSSDFLNGLIQVSRPSESFIGAAQKDMIQVWDRIAAN